MKACVLLVATALLLESQFFIPRGWWAAQKPEPLGDLLEVEELFPPPEHNPWFQENMPIELRFIPKTDQNSNR